MNQLLLLLYCFMAVFFVNPDSSFVLAFFCGIICAYSCNYASSDTYTLTASFFYALMGYFIPECLYFLPLIVYDIIYRLITGFSPRHFRYLLSASALIPAFHKTGLLFNGIYLSHLLIGGFLAFLLAKYTRDYDILENLYKKVYDDSTEYNLLLKEKNQSLLEKQDYEIYTATLKERNRIAREIHDNVGHLLTRSILLVGALEAINKDENLQEPLGNLSDTLSHAMNNIRESVHDLHDESINLKESIEGLLSEFTFCEVSFQFDMSYQLPRELKYAFISIVKEALVNVSRHSNATEVCISMREHPGFWQLCITDNGTVSGKHSKTDFSVQEISPGIGLKNIRERITALNGRVQFSQTPGFSIFATVPK